MGNTVLRRARKAPWQTEDLRSDIYSLGATLFHALTGRPPFDADTTGETVTDPALSLKTNAPDLNERTTQIVARMLARDPAEQYATYDELIQDLAEAQDELKGPRAVQATVAPTREKLSILRFVGTLATLVVCMVAIWFVSEKHARSLQPPPVAAGVANATSQDHQRGDEDTRVIDAVEPIVAPFLDNYDFKDALARYEACSQKISTATGHKLLDSRINRTRRLLEFKQQLAADFPPHPYDGADLSTRTGSPLPGKVVRAADRQIVCATTNGEIVSDWQDLARRRSSNSPTTMPPPMLRLRHPPPTPCDSCGQRSFVNSMRRIQRGTITPRKR